MKCRLYNIFSGDDLRIAELIQRRRLQILVHSYIYYDCDDNIVSDKTWYEWAKELEELQNKYPMIEKQVPYRYGFECWDGTTGEFLPYKTPKIIRTANLLFGKLYPNRNFKKSAENKKLGRSSLF